VNWCEIADHLYQDYTPVEDLDAEKTYKAWRTIGQAMGDYKWQMNILSTGGAKCYIALK